MDESSNIEKIKKLRQKLCELIGKSIKRKRNRVGITQAQMAKMLGVERSSVAKYEAGVIDVPASILVMIYMICGDNRTVPSAIGNGGVVVKQLEGIMEFMFEYIDKDVYNADFMRAYDCVPYFRDLINLVSDKTAFDKRIMLAYATWIKEDTSEEPGWIYDVCVSALDYVAADIEDNYSEHLASEYKLLCSKVGSKTAKRKAHTQ